MKIMRDPIDVSGFTLEVIYPSPLYSLERHEIIPYERFASNVFRECVQELTERHLPPHVCVSFSPIKSDYPAWAINCKVRPDTIGGTRFIIECPEMLPCMLILFSHIVTPHFRDKEISTQALDIKKSLQFYFDCASAAVRAFKSKGLASAVRAAYLAANIDFATIDDCLDDFDILVYLLANHEVAHIYLGQLTNQSKYPTEDGKAYEYLADLIATEWMCRRYIFLTPNDEHYREQRKFPTHAHALVANSRWALSGIFNFLVLMAVAGMQKNDGHANLSGGLSHPGSFGRSWLQQAWVITAIEGQLKAEIGEELWPLILGFWTEASEKIYKSGLITRASLWQAVDNEEMKTIDRVVQIAIENSIEEIMPGLEFLKSRGESAKLMRSKMTPLA